MAGSAPNGCRRAGVVVYLFRYREVSLRVSARCPDALAAVDDPTPGMLALRRLTTTKKEVAGRSCPGNKAVGATRRDALQESDGRRPTEGQRKGRPLLAAAVSTKVTTNMHIATI